MALREEEFERLQNQLLELKSCNYSLAESVTRKDAQITSLQNRTEELEKELAKMQTLAKINPLSYAKSMANRKDAKEKENLQQLTTELDQLNSKMESQEEEFKRTNEFLKQEMNSLLTENQKLRDFVEDSENGPQFLESLRNPDSTSSPSRSSSRSKSRQEDEFDIGRSLNHSSSQFALIAERERLNSQLLDLQHEFKQAASERDSLQERLAQVSADLHALRIRANESSELADVRKQTIDEMKTHIEEERQKSAHEISGLRTRHEAEVQQLKQEIATLSSLQPQLAQTEDRLRQVEQEMSRLQSECNQATSELTQVRQEVSLTKSYYETRISDCVREQEARVLLLQETHASEVQALQDQLAAAQADITRLKQEAEDGIEDRKIHEKKALLMMKELKKSLSSERKRAEKLQSRLQDFLSQSSLSLDADASVVSASAGDLPSPSSSSGFNANAPSNSGTTTTTTGTMSAAHHLLLTSSNTSTPVKSLTGVATTTMTTGVPCKSSERLNDTSSVGSWSFMSNSRNGEHKESGSNHSNTSNELPADSKSTTTTTTTTTAGEPHLHDSRHRRRRSSEQPVLQSSPSKSGTEVIAGHNSVQGLGGQEDQQEIRRTEDEGATTRAGLMLIDELECENRQLVSRISDLKQENWGLEERVNQLMGQVERLTIDNNNKGLIIEFYCMGGDAAAASSGSSSHSFHPHHHHHHHHHSSPVAKDKITVRKVVDFIKDRGDENLKEINRKLQRMLEETLTKNMFLQKDLEHLSDEVVRLSKQSLHPSSPSSSS